MNANAIPKLENIETNCIDKDDDCYIIVNAKLDDKDTSFMMSLRDAEEIGRAADSCYYREDVKNYFDDESKYDPAIFDDNELLDSITETYADARRDADGDEYGASWTECLKNAVRAFSDEVSKYERK